MQINRFTFFKTIGKVLARKELLDREVLTQPDQVHKRQFAQPLAVVTNLCLLWVEHAESLVGVGFRIGGDLLLSQNRTRLVLIRGIAHQRSVTPNEESHIMSQILKLTQFPHGDSVTKMQIGGSRVEAAIYT